MNPYRHNTKETEVAQVKGKKVRLLETTVDDVVVEITYQGKEGVEVATMSFEGSNSVEGVREHYDTPYTDSYFKSGTTKYQVEINVAAKNNCLWINDDLCVAWHRIFTTAIKKRSERKVSVKYIMVNERDGSA